MSTKLNYEFSKDDSKYLVTPCMRDNSVLDPKDKVKIGSMGCHICRHFVKANHKKQFVMCDATGEDVRQFKTFLGKKVIKTEVYNKIIEVKEQRSSLQLYIARETNPTFIPIKKLKKGKYEIIISKVKEELL